MRERERHFRERALERGCLFNPVVVVVIVVVVVVVVVVVLSYRRPRYSHHASRSLSLSLFFLFSLNLNRRFVQRQNVQRHRAERFGKVPAREV